MPARTTTLWPIVVAALSISAFLLVLNEAITPPAATTTSANSTANLTACDREAKICPDGSTVGRVLPKCTFAACPTTTTNSPGAVTNTTDTNASASSTNANQIPATYAVSEAIAQANTLNGRQLCLHGVYRQSFEFSAFGSSTKRDYYGDTVPVEPYIWVNARPSASTLTCTSTTSDRGNICQGTMTLCGTFHAAPAGQPGYGQANSYRYELGN